MSEQKSIHGIPTDTPIKRRNMRDTAEDIHLDKRIQQDIIKVARKNLVDQVVLFGSRARGDNTSKSDIDLAVYGCPDFLLFSEEMEVQVWTLLTFDLIDMNQQVSRELRQEIERDGIVIYSKENDISLKK